MTVVIHCLSSSSIMVVVTQIIRHRGKLFSYKEEIDNSTKFTFQWTKEKIAGWIKQVTIY